ncbi:MAG TPA: DUF3147 family protein [Victivallales bacterium]|nr:DUF3147 family protein [Victivallales bacterium]
MPIVTIMVMIWLCFENQSSEKIATYAFYTFWYVMPTIPMFLLLPYLLSKGINFWLTLLFSLIVTIIFFIITAWISKKFGVNLIP